MKYLSKITLGLILCMGLMASCNDDNEGAGSRNLTVDKEEITIGENGGTEAIAISANTNWVASSSQPWISISPANGLGSADCSLAIDSTLEKGYREAQIRFTADGQEPKMVKVIQFGYGKQIILKEPTMEIESSARYDDRYFDVTISTNVAFTINKSIDYSFAEISEGDEGYAEVESDKDDWITLPKDSELEIKLDRKDRPRTIKVRFKWTANTAPYTRIAKIHLVPDEPLEDNEGNPTEEVILTVNQKAAPKITDDRAGDSLAIVTINEKIQSMIAFETSENMRNWESVTLWEETDENVPDGAVGRVRSVQFMMFDLKDGEEFPKEIRYLKYLESLTLQTNSNWQLRGDVSLGEEISNLENLKELIIYAYGITKLPDNFINLGSHLETLGLASNGFATLSAITNVVNKVNFPKLTALNLTGCRRTDTLKDLTELEEGKSGLHINLNKSTERDAFKQLLSWDKLIELSLSYNFIEGTLPDDDEMTAYLKTHSEPETYQPEDFFEGRPTGNNYLNHISKDTCSWLINDNQNNYTVTYKYGNYEYTDVKGQEIPRVLPFARRLTFNLNFLTGALPKWVLFHPYFVEWGPEILIFTQQEDGLDSSGNKVGFNNIDADKFDYTYYYSDGKNEAIDNYTPGNPVLVEGYAYPLYYKRYVAN